MGILRRRKRGRREHDVRKIICNAHDPLSFSLITREEFEQILKLTGALVLKETLGATCLAGMPAELRSTTIVLGLLAHNKRIPSFMNKRLVKKTIDNARVHPVTFGHARFEMTSNMLNMALAGGVKSRTEATSPVLALAQELDHFLSMRARLAAVTLFVMLVERIGTPEATVTARLGARILAPALMKLILVTLPIVLALEARLARGAPVNVRFSSSADWWTEWTGNGWCRRKRKRCLRSAS